MKPNGLHFLTFVGLFTWALVCTAVAGEGTRNTGNDSTWRFMATGDSRGSSSLAPVNQTILSELSDAAVRENVDLIVLPGDLVLSGLQSSFEIWTNTMSTAYAAGIGIYPCRGNHDLGSAWNTIFSQYLPTNGPPGETYYTYFVTNRNACFISVDEYVNRSRVNQPWLDEVLAAADQLHIFVFGHEPAFQVHHSDCMDDYPDERNRFWESLRDGRCRAYFCGHDHLYDHARLDDGDGNPSNDLHQFVVGTAGAPPYPDPGSYRGNNGLWTPIRQLFEGQYGYVLGEIDGDRVTLTWKHRTGTDSYQAAEVFSYTASPALPRLRLSLPSSAVEGDGVLLGLGRVWVPQPAVSNLVIDLATDDSSELLLENSVVILQGTTGSLFDVTVVDDSILDGTRDVFATATAPGYRSGKGTTTVLDNETATLRIYIPTEATEGDGVLVSAGVVAVEGQAPAETISISLYSSDSSEVTVPGTVSIPAGSVFATFDLSVIDDTAIDGEQTVDIFPGMENWSNTTASVVIADNESTNMSINLPAWVTESDGVLTNAGEVSISGTLPGDLSVILTGSPPGELVLPPNVSIPAGAISVSFSIGVLDDNLHSEATDVLVTARAVGFVSATGSLQVANDDFFTHYVATGGLHRAPFTNWVDAATNLQAAVDRAGSGETVLVDQGTYHLVAPVVFSNRIAFLSSRSGPAVLNGLGGGRCLEVYVPGVEIDGFTIQNGSAPLGGGLYTSQGIELRNCLFRENSAPTEWTWIDAAGWPDDGYWTNRFGRGGGIYVKGGGSLINCTVVGNSAGEGGGIYSEDAVLVENSILYYNVADSGPNWVHLGRGTYYQNSCTTPYPLGSDGLMLPPRFLGAGSSDCRLQPDSPCIDSGSSISEGTTDISGVSRPLDGDSDGTSRCDMGAFEFLHPAADSDRDGMPDGEEIIAGTDPGDSGSALILRETLAVDDFVMFSWTGIAGRLYTVECSDDPVAGSWSNLLLWVDLDGMGAEITFSNVAPASLQQFFRVKVMK